MMLTITVKCEKEVPVDVCPFCHEGSSLCIKNYQGHHVKCNNCNASGPKAKTEEKAVELWNVGIVRGGKHNTGKIRKRCEMEK